jgi:hypothetical protein
MLCLFVNELRFVTFNIEMCHLVSRYHKNVASVYTSNIKLFIIYSMFFILL